MKPARPNLETSSSIADVLIAGAGIIGLSLALELHLRGARVTVLEAGKALQQASSAAAGMLAAHDPHNPTALLPLANFSAALYPAFLSRIEPLSGLAVPFQTETTLQLRSGRIERLAERSLDPRQLAPALLAAVRATSIHLHEDTGLQSTQEDAHRITVISARGDRFSASTLIYAMGAWALPGRLRIPIAPRKGQMLRVRMPSHMPIDEVHRSDRIYIVPRTRGPQAGTALIGATVEDAGFDTTPHVTDLARLRSLAADLLPALAREADAPMVEAWAGLRPYAPDGLPLLGRIGETAEIIASGHFRNGILLAPATAFVLADRIEGKMPALDLSAFAPLRFS